MEKNRDPKHILDYRSIEKNLNDHERDYWTDIVVRSKQVFFWPTFVTRGRRR